MTDVVGSPNSIILELPAAAVLVANGATPALDMTADQLNALIKTEIAKWRRIVKERKLDVNL